MRRFLFFLIYTTLITPFSVSIAAEKDRLMVVTEHMPPFQIIDKNPRNPIQGYSVDVLRATLKQAHIDYTIMPMTWDRAYSLGQKKPNTLILSVVRKPAREKMFHWLIKLNNSKTSLWSYKGNQKVLMSLADITDEIIAVDRNDHHQLILKDYPNLTEKNIIYTTSKEQAIALVAKHRAHYFMGNESILNWRFKLAQLDKNDIVEVFEFAQLENDLYIAASRDTSPIIRRKIKKAYSQLQVNGKIKAIADKWF